MKLKKNLTHSTFYQETNSLQKPYLDKRQFGNQPFTNPICQYDQLTYTDWLNLFLMNRRARNRAEGTLHFYRDKLRVFFEHMEQAGVTNPRDINTTAITSFIVYLVDTQHAPAGVHAYYRAIKAFFKFFDAEIDDPSWHNPMRRVIPPSVPEKILDPVEPETVSILLGTCNTQSFLDRRDKAIMLTLWDTGVRANELLQIDLDDIDIPQGLVQVRMGKGRKPRPVFVGTDTKKAIRAYLATRDDIEKSPALFINNHGDRLKYDGLSEIIQRRSKQAGIQPPTLHSFRRAHALQLLKAGLDLESIRALLGHSTMAVLKKYLKQDNEDLKTKHSRAEITNVLTFPKAGRKVSRG